MMIYLGEIDQNHGSMKQKIHFHGKLVLCTAIYALFIIQNI